MINERPTRECVSSRSLSLVGIPKAFHNKTLADFNTYGSSELERVQQFVKEYIIDLSNNFNECSGILLYGSNGVGKTFLSCMILKEAYRRRYTSRRVTFVEYINAYTKIWSTHSLDEKELLEGNFYTQYKAVEFLVLEEVGKEVDSKISAPILEDLLRYREDHGLVTIMCTNIEPKELKNKYGASCYSLMQGNMIPVLISGKDKRKEYFNKR